MIGQRGLPRKHRKGYKTNSSSSKRSGQNHYHMHPVGANSKPRQEQAGFRKGRGTVEKIFILRNIIDQCIKCNSNLYVCFVAFEKTFDSLHRATLWRIMRSYVIPEKIARLVKAMYNRSERAVINGSGVYDWFERSIPALSRAPVCLVFFFYL